MEASLVKTVRWAFMVQGVLAIAFGICAMVFTGSTIDVLLALLAAFWIVEGLVEIFAGLSGRHEGRWTLVFLGVLSVVAGIVVLRMPDVTILVTMILVAFWALVTGFNEVVGAFTLRGSGVASWGFQLISGVLSVALGVLLLIAPFSGLSALVWVMGFWAILRGIALLVLGAGLERRLSVTAEPAAR